jgi:hypothetical protein
MKLRRLYVYFMPPRVFIRRIAWRVFLWSIRQTEEEYFYNVENKVPGHGIEPI